VKALAIDFGGTHATCGLVEGRVLLAHETIDTNCAKSLQAVLPRIRDACHELMQGRELSSRDLAGVAIGFAALVDSRVNQILATDGKYEDAKEIDLAGWVVWADTFRQYSMAGHVPVGRLDARKRKRAGGHFP
jgi:predicted NBD/HSP70 family sugar kinase